MIYMISLNEFWSHIEPWNTTVTFMYSSSLAQQKNMKKTFTNDIET